MSKKCLYMSERVLIEDMAKKPENSNLAAATLMNILNRSRQEVDAITMDAMVDELKLGGARNDRQGIFTVVGYHVPSRKCLKKFLQDKRLWKLVKDDENIVPRPSDQTVENTSVETQVTSEEVSVKEKILAETPVKKVSVESESCSDCISCQALTLLRYIYHSRMTKISMHQMICKNDLYKVAVYKAAKELEANGLLQKQDNNPKAYKMPNWDEVYSLVPEFKIPLKDGELDVLKTAVKKTKNVVTTATKPMKVVDKEAYIRMFDDGYTVEDAIIHEGDERQDVLKTLVEHNIVTMTASGAYCPTYDWQQKKVSPVVSNDDIPLKAAVNEQTPANEETPKDIVLEFAKVRIQNESGLNIRIVIKDNEVIVKI